MMDGEYLREGGALGPDGAILAEDRCGSEMLTVDLAHEMIIDVGLPRHLFSLPFFFSYSSLPFSSPLVFLMPRCIARLNAI